MVQRGRESGAQTADPQMETEAEDRWKALMETEAEDRWKALIDGLVCSILAKLPVRDQARMRIVCKRWNSLLSPGDALQRIDPNFSVICIPGFFIQLGHGPQDLETGPQDLETWVIELGDGGSDLNIYNPRFPNDQIVVDSCQSICCSHRRGDSLDLSIGNPATRTWRRLPRPASRQLPRPGGWDFIAMTFDSTMRRSTILLGENNVEQLPRGTGNSMVLRIYDSESNAWTRVSMETLTFIQPHGKGLYSKGNLYWIIQWNAYYSMVAFAIAEITWKEIALPEGCCRNVLPYPTSLYLSGCDGRVVLIQKGEESGSIRMWRLNEGQGAAEWFELHAICSPKTKKFYSVVANSGWAMMVDRKNQIYFRNPERKLTKKVALGGRLGRPEGSFIQFLSAFHSNNVWWP